MNCEGWKKVRLCDVPIEIIDGDRGKNYPNGEDFTDSGYCLFLNAKNVTSSGFSFEQKMFISKEKDVKLRKGKLERNDVVLTTRGTVGNVAYYDDNVEFLNMRINSGMVIIRCDFSQLYSPFIYWLFRSPIIQDQIYSIKTGSAQPQLPISIMRNLEFILPSRPEQKAIAAVLSALDDKIELNNKINKNLEKIAQSIFKSWFVDFEPFQDGELVESELGMIPNGWRVGKFTDVVQIVGGGTPKTDNSTFWNGEIPFFTPKDASSSVYSIDAEKHLTVAGLNNCNSDLFPVNTVFVTARGTVGKLALAGKDMAMNQSCYALIGKDGYSQQFVYQLAENTVEALKHKANGAVFNAIVTRDFESEYILTPNKDSVSKYTSVVEPLYSAILENTLQNQKLIELRDTLLPKLMSGEIDVSKISI